MALMMDNKPTEYKGEALVWEKLSSLLPNDVVVYNHREVVDDREFDFALLIKNVIPFESLYVSTYIHQQVEENQADRVERFIRVWGNASDLEYEENGTKYLGGMPIGFFDDLGIPTFLGRKGDKPVKVSVEPIKRPQDGSDVTPPPEPVTPKVDPAMADFLLGQRTLQIWIDGGELNVGATTKDVVNITKARDERT